MGQLMGHHGIPRDAIGQSHGTPRDPMDSMESHGWQAAGNFEIASDVIELYNLMTKDNVTAGVVVIKTEDSIESTEEAPSLWSSAHFTVTRGSHDTVLL